MENKKLKTKEYFVVYASKDTGYYRTTYWVVCVVQDEEVAKDLCQKFGYSYVKETVGGEKTTPRWVKSKEEGE